jgi:hypothetical protein
MEKIKKTLLIFFGEYRTFSIIPQQLYHLDKVDVIFSTWKNAYLNNKRLPQSKIDLITKLVPHAKVLMHEDVYDNTVSHNFRMWYHWISALNSVENEDEYDKVLLHRCDLISNWHIILNQKWKDDTLYTGTAGEIELNKFWINDYYLGGNFKFLKKFVNLFEGMDEKPSHFPIGNVILKNDISYTELNIGTLLVRPFAEDFFYSLNENNILFFEQPSNSKVHRKYIELYNSHYPNFKIDEKTWAYNLVFKK